MSRNFNLTVECLGTTLSWDCGSSLAKVAHKSIEDALNELCEANKRSGDGFNGITTHKTSGLAAYHKVLQVSDWLWKRDNTRKALLLRELLQNYGSVLKSSQELAYALLGENDCEDLRSYMVDTLLEDVGKLNVTCGLSKAIMRLKELELWPCKHIEKHDLEDLIARESWALSIEVSATY